MAEKDYQKLRNEVTKDHPSILWEDPYPVTVVRDRHDGIVSGGRWLAFPLHSQDVPFAFASRDTGDMAFGWFRTHADGLVGRGDTVERAYADLCSRIRDLCQGGEVENPTEEFRQAQQRLME